MTTRARSAALKRVVQGNVYALRYSGYSESGEPILAGEPLVCIDRKAGKLTLIARDGRMITTPHSDTVWVEWNRHTFLNPNDPWEHIRKKYA